MIGPRDRAPRDRAPRDRAPRDRAPHDRAPGLSPLVLGHNGGSNGAYDAGTPPRRHSVVAERACMEGLSLVRWPVVARLPDFLRDLRRPRRGDHEGDSVMKIALVAEQASQHTPARSAAAADPGSHALRPCMLARTLGGLGHHVTIYARKDAPALSARAIVA